jgi:hypothetical protein
MPVPAGGQVIVTRFECPSLRVLVYLLALHVRVKRDVRRHAPGLIASRVVVRWRQRTMLSISLWPDLDSVYDMGSVPRHVMGSRIPGQLGVVTSSGVFTFAGDWRRVMFGSPAAPRSPLLPLRTQ